MSWLAAALYGLIQGVTEFLPISSDGHLALAAFVLGDVYALPLGTVVLLHLGTLVATFVVLRTDVREVGGASLAALRHPSLLSSTAPGRIALTVVLASVPTAIVGLALHDVVEPLAQRAEVVGLCLILTAGFVASTHWAGPRAQNDEPSLALGPALALGFFQGLAVLPGLSRSGTTIAVAMLLGLTPSASFRLSFLLSLPAVLGAVLLELRHPEVWQAAGPEGLFGALVSFVVGLAALYWVRSWLAKGRFAAFAIYCAVLGLGLVGYVALG